MIKNADMPVDLNSLRDQLTPFLGDKISDIIYVQAKSLPPAPLYSIGNLVDDVDDGVILNFVSGSSLFVRWAPPGDWSALSIAKHVNTWNDSNLNSKSNSEKTQRFLGSKIAEIRISKTPSTESRIWSFTLVAENEESITISIGEIDNGTIESSMDNICVIYDRKIASQYQPFFQSHGHSDINAYGVKFLAN